MKSIIVQPGEYIRPSGAQLRSVPNEAAAVKVWEEVGGECFAYPKPDGWRIQIHKIGASVKLFTRKGHDYAEEYPSIVQMIRTQIEDDLAILDTELVGFDQNGHHLAPARLRGAAKYRCYLLDALYLRSSLISLPTRNRVAFIREHLRSAFDDMFAFAEYTLIRSQNDLINFYRACLVRRKDGFDGAIIKRLSTSYFTDALKLKAEDTVDAVVIGAYRDEEDVEWSLLLSVPSYEHKCWIPVAKVTRTNADWDIIWAACRPYILDHRPPNLYEISDIPDIWITPQVVVEVTMSELLPGKNYLVRAEYPRRCTLREDKGPEEATSLEQILQIADMAKIMKILSERAKRKQHYLFKEYDSVVSEHIFDEDKGVEDAISIEQNLPTEGLIQQGDLVNKNLIQLSLFKQ